MKTSAATTTFLLSLLVAWPSAIAAKKKKYLDPHVKRIEKVLPPSVCKQLIDLGEKSGFNVKEESIDEIEQDESEFDPSVKYVPSQTIDVYTRILEGEEEEEDEDEDDEERQNPAIWEALQPWLPRISQIVKDNRNKAEFSKMYPNDPDANDREPSLDWIFFRKYSPDDERNSLKHHHDTNMNTVNIELSNDYEGGGIFYIKPLASTGNISRVYNERGYEWIDTLKRENTTSLVFPDLHAGDAIFYNYTVEHGVAPCESGSRYSMAFFFDMDNPAVAKDLEEEEEEEEDFEVEFHNGLVDQEVDIYALIDYTEEGPLGYMEWEKDLLYSNVQPNESKKEYMEEGELVRVVLAGTTQIISEFEIKNGTFVYTVEDYLEPNVQRIEGVLPLNVCKHLIDLGEEAGFNVKEESIDTEEQEESKFDSSVKYIPSQTIDVYTRLTDDDGEELTQEEIMEDDMMDKPIWEALQPWIPKIAQIVKDNRNKAEFSKMYPDDPDMEPVLDWIFFRKYSPDDERNSLKHHHDTNMNTVNIELSNHYEGGGIFYIKPLASTGNISSVYDDRGYEWIDTIKRENTSELIFPDLHAGDAIFYNYTVEHGVAACESGTRYCMAFFFDMDNPAVAEDLDDLYEDDSGDLEEGEFEVELRNDFPDMKVDIVLVIDEKGEEVWEDVFDNVKVNETTVFVAVEGDHLKVLKAGTDDELFDVKIKRDKSVYAFSQDNLSDWHTEL